MRTSLVLSFLLAVAAGGCSQPLTPEMTGTGGAGTGTGDTGGSFNLGAGGAIMKVGPVCGTLVAEYQSALTQAVTCQVGASGQCQQIVIENLSGCSCSTYVTDTSVLTTVRKAWDAANCQPVDPPCVSGCPIALNTTCVAVDGGSTGVCSYVPGVGLPGTGGISGSGGDGASGGTTGAGGSPGSEDAGLDLCGTLSSEYLAVLAGAKSCTAGAGVQCATPVPAALSACGSCTDYVNDSSVLDTIRMNWQAAGCENVNVFCPSISCVQPVGAMCTASDAGGSVCVPAF